MSRAYDPPLSLTQTGGRLRLRLGDICHGHGDTLQEAADDLVRRLLSYLVAVRSTGVQAHPGLGADLPLITFLHELAQTAADGGDIRQRLFAQYQP